MQTTGVIASYRGYIGIITPILAWAVEFYVSPLAPVQTLMVVDFA